MLYNHVNWSLFTPQGYLRSEIPDLLGVGYPISLAQISSLRFGLKHCQHPVGISDSLHHFYHYKPIPPLAFSLPVAKIILLLATQAKNLKLS